MRAISIAGPSRRSASKAWVLPLLRAPRAPSTTGSIDQIPHLRRVRLFDDTRPREKHDLRRIGFFTGPRIVVRVVDRLRRVLVEHDVWLATATTSDLENELRAVRLRLD